MIPKNEEFISIEGSEGAPDSPSTWYQSKSHENTFCIMFNIENKIFLQFEKKIEPVLHTQKTLFKILSLENNSKLYKQKHILRCAKGT